MFYEIDTRTLNWFVKLVQQDHPEPVKPDPPELVEIVVHIVPGKVDLHPAVVLQNLG